MDRHHANLVMFALPGLGCLIVFMYLRPQEHWTVLQKLPFLYIFFAAAVGGLMIDLKLRLLKPNPTRSLILGVAFFAWVLINNGIKVPAAFKVGNIIGFTIVFVTYVVLCQGIQSFRAFRFIGGFLVFICMFLTIVGIHQATAPYGCMKVANRHLGIGVPDGRPCVTIVECLGDGAEPGAAYDCTRIGLMGTTAIADRVRYRGELQDPNELALAVCAGLPWLIAFAARKKGFRFKVMGVVGCLLIFQCVIDTQSRGGMLVFLAVIGIQFIAKYGIKYAFLGVFAVIPMMAAGGRSGAAADESTRQRYEAWATGVSLFRMDPVFGAGHRMFTQYHYLTAHNSYVLAAAELGFIGFVLWMSILYITIKVPLMAFLHFRHDARAGPAKVWGLCLLGMAAAYVVQYNFLSLTYHTITWIYFGVSGAFYSAVKAHAPDWDCKFALKDLMIVIGICIGFLIVLPPFLTLKGF